MKMLEAAKASPRSQAIRKDSQGRGWWKGFEDESFMLIDLEGHRVEYASFGTPSTPDDWIPVMDFTSVGYPLVIWEASMAAWESKKLRKQVDLLRAYTAYMFTVVEGLVTRLGVEARDEVTGIAMWKLKELSGELKQLDTGV